MRTETITLNHKTISCWNQCDTNSATDSCKTYVLGLPHFTLHSLFTVPYPGNIPHLADMWQCFASVTGTVIISINRLALLHVPETSLYFHFTLHWCAALLYGSKTSCYFHCFFSETIVSGIWWVRTVNSEGLTQENDTLRSNASSIIIHSLYGRLFGDQKTWKMSVEKQCARMMNGGFTVCVYVSGPTNVYFLIKLITN